MIIIVGNIIWKLEEFFLQSESPIQEREDIPPPETETEDQTKSATYSRLVEDEDEFMYIRESNSAPLDSPVLKGMQCTYTKSEIVEEFFWNFDIG